MNPEDEIDYLDDEPVVSGAMVLPRRRIVAGVEEVGSQDTPEDVAASIDRKGLPGLGGPIRGDEDDRGIAETLADSLRASREGMRTLEREAATRLDDELGISRTLNRARDVPVVGEYLQSWLDSGTSGASGAANSLAFGDEAAGAVGALDAWAHDEDMGDAYERVRDDARETMDRERERSPRAFLGGELAGALATAPVLPSGAGRGASMAARLGRGAAEGAAYGGLFGYGASEGDTVEDQLADTGRAAAFGGAVGGLGAAAGEAVGALGRSLRRGADAADELRVVAPAGGTGAEADAMRSIPVSPRRTASGEMVQPEVGSSERMADIAATLRRLGIDGGTSTADDFVAASERARDAAGAELGAFRDRVGEIPASTVTDAMERFAQELEAASSGGVPLADAVRARAARFGESTRGAETIPYSRALSELDSLGSAASWIDRAGREIRPGEEAARGLYGAVRGALDDQLLPEVGEDALDAYRRARLDYAAANTARNASLASRARNISNRGFSPSDYWMAGPTASAGLVHAAHTGDALSALGGLGSAVLIGAANRGFRLREPAIRAAMAETVRSALGTRAARALGEYAGPLRRALERGADQFFAVHEALLSSDPEYAQVVTDMADESGAEEITTEEELMRFLEETNAPIESEEELMRFLEETSPN